MPLQHKVLREIQELKELRDFRVLKEPIPVHKVIQGSQEVKGLKGLRVPIQVLKDQQALKV